MDTWLNLYGKKEVGDIADHTVSGILGQKFAGTAAVNFIWSAIPYRCEWRYVYKAHKVMLLGIDKLLGLDGEDEFVVYILK